MRTSLALAASAAIAPLAAVAFASAAAALPECMNTAPLTRQCERGTHVQINTSPNVNINDGPFIENPWLYPVGIGAFGGWTLP